MFKTIMEYRLCSKLSLSFVYIILLVLVPSKPQVCIPLKTIFLLGQLGVLKRQLPNHLTKTRVLLCQVANDTGCSGQLFAFPGQARTRWDQWVRDHS
ncbi:hypothetical protein K457DRAFT_449759 [Linnemannia elongata AG-77]|uniref:Uncharacterized protein n=1 Tax=Linnemannia elongata AG-77 TaxID=1314771 RepID=A0A197K1V7_9FUNG|nr:hypothetical protein K457DRAFT_449759 [Linnemannia elongata AG-77]